MGDRRILVFVCNWCSLGGADQAGGLKLPSPDAVRLVRVMCSGRVDPQLVLKSFREGADGVLILGCHPGGCHYKEGNYFARNRATLLSKMLTQYGVEPERFRLDWVSAGEGERFARVVGEMDAAIAALGPLDLHPRSLMEAMS
jgi:F420-non-reducing hydrogenase iron-sulfur subunit